MTDFIEHPDHTGASANPSAPWNRPDAEPAKLECDTCGHEPDPDLEYGVGDACHWTIKSALDPCDGCYVEVER